MYILNTRTHTHTERILSRETFSEVKRLTVEKQPSVALYTRFKFIVTQYGKVAVLFHASGLVLAMVLFFSFFSFTLSRGTLPHIGIYFRDGAYFFLLFPPFSFYFSTRCD
jgi:hypothetical protein